MSVLDLSSKELSHHSICCTLCNSSIRISAFTPINNYLCSLCRSRTSTSHFLQTPNGTFKSCKDCKIAQPLANFITVNKDGLLYVQEYCVQCRESFSKMVELKYMEKQYKELLPKVVTQSPSSVVLEASVEIPPLENGCVQFSKGRQCRKLKKLSYDLKITSNELRMLVPEEVFRGLHDDRYEELIICATNPSELVTIVPDEKERQERVLSELVVFYHATHDKVLCHGCKRSVIKADCFLHHSSYLCRDCSMKVAANNLTDWVTYSPVLLKCGRCKHFAAYHKFLKFNGRGEIKRQNTCAFCCLKKWREYYLGVRPY